MRRYQTNKMTKLLTLLMTVLLLAALGPVAHADGMLYHARRHGSRPEKKSPVPVVTTEALLEANRYENLLEKYGIVVVETLQQPDAEQDGGYSLFCGTADYDFYYYDPAEADGLLASLMTEQNFYRFTRTADGSLSFSIDWDAEPGWDEGRYDLLEDAMVLDETWLLNAQIADVTDNRDGTLTITLLEEPAFYDDWAMDPYAWGEEPAWYNTPAEYEEPMWEPDSMEWSEGLDILNWEENELLYPGEELNGWEEDWFPTDEDWYPGEDAWGFEDAYQPEEESVLTLVVDAETLEIRSITETAVYDDGREELLLEQYMLYVAPEFDVLDQLLEKAVHYELGELEDPRTVTVIYNAGEMDELVLTRTVEKGDALLTTFLEGYELYADEAGTPFLGGDGQGDITIYAFPYDHVFPMPEDMPAELSDEPDVMPDDEGSRTELDFSEINFWLFEANKLDAILSRHQSAEYRLVYGADLDNHDWDYVYETAEMAYEESPDSAIYVRDGAMYDLEEDENGANLYYVFDFCNDYDLLLNAGYEIVPEDFDDWWDEETESAVACYEENGEIHLLCGRNEDGSRAFIEEYLQLPYDGEYVTTEAVANAMTGELTKLIYRVDKDGMVEEPLTYLISYDRPEPRACRNLRAAAERHAEQTVEVTLVAYPGSDREQRQSKTLPIGSNAVYIANDWMALYEDPDCTVPAGQWDKMTDHIYYMRPAYEQTME